MAIDFKNYFNKISNSGNDERGKYSGGSAGDQTGHEWEIRSWYSRPWTCVLRYPDQKVGDMIAQLSIEAANNNKIGYDQNQRDTYWNALQKANYRPSKITTNCEADCSAGVIANTKAAGYLLNISKLKTLAASYTGNMRTGFKNAGFEVLTDSKYLSSPDYLLPGDILLYDGHHTATNLGIGSKAKYTEPSTPSTPTPAPTPTLTPSTPTSESGRNLTTTKTAEIQEMLNVIMKSGLKIDGSYGPLTTTAVKAFQKKYKLTESGNVDETTLKKMKDVYIGTVLPFNTSGNYNESVKLQGKVTANVLNIRKGPGTSYGKLSSYPTLKKGTTVGICDKIRATDGSTWYYIKISGSKGDKHGFAGASYIEII